ncbi:GABA/polyamine transporter [Castilleja foliolosa]|uniref:GABA/polyamine transporter n=1 Tax=Castilleja foliolosa TaxID=1961234 RepID=A0ABD3D4P4_9LAMI
MISSLKQPAFSVHASDFLQPNRNSIGRRSPVLPPLAAEKTRRSSALSISKPLHVSKVVVGFSNCGKEREERSLITRGAYEAERSGPINEPAVVAPPESARKLKIGSLIMLISWALRIAETPKTDLDFWKSLFPVAVAHTIGHVAATVSMSKVAVSFTHIIKSGEPAFSVLVSRFILGETFPPAVYLSLLPIIGGCGLAALTELNFNMIGFMGAMISNLAFVFRNIFSKKGMKGKSVSGMNYYACLSIMSLLILTPFAIAVEGPQMWAAGFKEALSQTGPQIVWWMAAQSIFYHFYNQVSYMSLDEISPLTFSIGNTMKRISVIVSSIIIFQTPVRPVNALGAAIAVLGTFLYSQPSNEGRACK